MISISQNKGLDDFYNIFEKGIKNENVTIPLQFPVLNGYISGLRKYLYVLVGGLSGSGKTSFVDNAFVLDVYDWWIKEYKEGRTKIKLNWIYRSMERDRKYKIAKWTCYKIYKDHGILLDVPDILSWKNSDKANQYKDLILSYKDYFIEMFQYVDLIDGAASPIGLYKYNRDYADLHFDKIEESEYVNRYVPKDENLHTIILNDHRQMWLY